MDLSVSTSPKFLEGTDGISSTILFPIFRIILHTVGIQGIIFAWFYSFIHVHVLNMNEWIEWHKTASLAKNTVDDKKTEDYWSWQWNKDTAKKNHYI